MTRRVVFAGGIQAKALAKAYRHDVAYDRDDDVYFIGSESMAREAAHRVIAAADIVITDVTETGDTVPDHLIPPNAHRIGVPVIIGDFLWPFAGRPHPRNRGTPSMPEGPYPASFGDAFLDRMLQAGMPENEAVARYLALDVAAEVDLDAMLRERLMVQARIDVMTGFDIAGFIDSEFRRQNLFATRDRLRVPLLREVARTVFGRIGARAGSEQAILEARFPTGALPIHPSVLRHFGMQAPSPDHRYPMLDEGMFTFEQYCRRYLRFEWNEALHAAILLAESDPAAAIPALRDALESSPGSRAGQQALEEAERAVSDSSLLAPLALTSSASPAPDPQPVLPDPMVPQSEAGAWAQAEPPDSPDGPAEDAEPGPEHPVFAGSAFADLHLPNGSTPPDGAGTPFEISFTSFAKTGISHPDVGDPAEDPGLDLETVPEPQSYVELPVSFGSYDEAPTLRVASTPTDRYTPLEPAKDLIEVLPRMLSATRGLAHAAESPFSAMPETMPPPPLRPVLPPELQSEPVKRGLVARLFGGRGLG